MSHWRETGLSPHLPVLRFLGAVDSECTIGSDEYKIGGDHVGVKWCVRPVHNKVCG